MCTAILCAAVLFTPRAASAQAAIAGVVKDTTGAVLPGVTVEASSPALIEKTRSVITDSSGQYKILDLSPGRYQVAFTLVGFKTVQRGEIVLEGNFAAQVNADLQVGSVEELITVTAESPAVDVVNNATRFVVNRDVLDSIPVPTRNTPSRALLIPGTTVTPFVLGQYNMTVHGSATSDMVIAIDGMRVNNLCGSGQFSGFYMNDASVQEVTYTTGAESAEMQAGGLRINSIPKDGGNTFSGTFFAYGQGSSLQADNRSDAVEAVHHDRRNGLRLSVQSVVRRTAEKRQALVLFHLQVPGQQVLRPQLEVPRRQSGIQGSDGQLQRRRPPHLGRQQPRQDPRLRREAVSTASSTTASIRSRRRRRRRRPTRSATAGSPRSSGRERSRAGCMLEAGLSYYNQPYEQNYKSSGRAARSRPPGSNHQPADRRRRQHDSRLTRARRQNYSMVASASYVTGSHAIKAGMTNGWGTNSRTFTSHAEINTLVFGGGAPLLVVVANTPASAVQKVNSDLGMFVQDTWTRKRLTLNYGGRYDHFNAEVPAESSPAGNWIAARNFPAIKDVPNWDDWSVRLAAAYDLFGTGKTALKVNAGKYVASQAAGYAANFNGMTYSTQQRAWNDADRNGTIFDTAGNIQFSEVLGGTSNFGQITVRPDPNLERGYNWEYSASVQHELAARVSVTAGYYRRQFYNLQIVDNQNVTASEWNPFTIQTPTDPRLPTSGTPIQMFNLNANKVGTATDGLYTFSTANQTIYNGFELSANVRRNKFLMFGGVTTDRRATTSCDGSTATNGTPNATSGTSARDNPNASRFCDSPPPFRTTFKASAAYSFPWDVQLSGSYLGDPRPEHQRELHRHISHRGPNRHRVDCRRHDDQRQPGTAEHRVPRLPKAVGHEAW